MRDLLFKNLTSVDKRRKILVSAEVVDKQGVRSIIRRHFVCIVREIKDNQIDKPQPYISVLKERNNREQKEKFFCKIKGSIYAMSQGRPLLILFMHSLKIDIMAMPQNPMQL
ncbi:MAG: hypothetical protein KKE91_00490 [Candidatus Omnitrophica bacterium]|nr:hypothetical protein [Candidatus Omnitrophota bacterium]MCG2706899.1 hypothetical protein [Candidatus Omnitrophota bacterium]